MPLPGRFNLDLNEPISPDVGLGGLRLRTSLIFIQKSITHALVSRTGRYEMVDAFEARYYVAEGAVAIGVDIRNGKVFRLSAMRGYTGVLFGRVAVGMRVSEAFALVPNLYHNEALGLIKCRDPHQGDADIAGLAIDVGVDDPVPRLVPSMSIHAISVYIANIFMEDGMNGTW